MCLTSGLEWGQNVAVSVVTVRGARSSSGVLCYLKCCLLCGTLWGQFELAKATVMRGGVQVECCLELCGDSLWSN